MLLPPLYDPASGDGMASRGDGLDGAPLPPGQLVVTEVLLADELPRGAELPLFLETVPAGFPSPADDYVEERLDLHEILGATSPSCYFLRVSGVSMIEAGIQHGDVLVVDRALRPKNGSVVVASVDGELTVKRFVRRGDRVVLLAANPDYPPIELTGEQELIVWGVVKHSLHDHSVRGPA